MRVNTVLTIFINIFFLSILNFEANKFEKKNFIFGKVKIVLFLLLETNYYLFQHLQRHSVEPRVTKHRSYFKKYTPFSFSFFPKYIQQILKYQIKVKHN